MSWTIGEVMIAEMEVHMTRIPSSGHLCAWAGVALANHEPAGKRHPPRLDPATACTHRSRQSDARTKGSYFSA